MRRQIAVIAAVSLFSAACSQPMPMGQTIKVGVLYAQTGSNSSVGTVNIDTVALAIEQINKAGGVLNGTMLEPVLADTKSTVDGAKEAATTLAAANVPIVFGDWSSARTQQAIRIFKDAKIVEIAVATSPAIGMPAEPDDGYFFRTAPSDAYQTKLLARRAKEKGFTKVAILHIPGAYGQGLADAFNTAFVAQGGTVTKNLEYVEEQTSYVSYLNQVFADPVEAIALFGYSADAATILKDYNTQFSTKGVTWYFTDAVEEQAFVTGVGTANSNWAFQHEGSGQASPKGANFDAFVSAFKTKYARDPEIGTSCANVFDSVFVGAMAIEAAGKAEGTAIRDALTKVAAAPGDKFSHTQFKDAIAAIKAGKDVDYDGVTGTIDFDSTGEVLAPYHLWKVQDGKIQITVESIDP